MANPRNDSPRTYLIQISEEQRVSLHRVLQMAETMGDVDLKDDGPLTYWIEMLAELPTTDPGDGKMINGFCL